MRVGEVTVARPWRLIAPGRIAAPAPPRAFMQGIPALDDIHAAAVRIREHVSLSRVETLDQLDARLQVKLELLQPTGSFKIRGAAERRPRR